MACVFVFLTRQRLELRHGLVQHFVHKVVGELFDALLLIRRQLPQRSHCLLQLLLHKTVSLASHVFHQGNHAFLSQLAHELFGFLRNHFSGARGCVKALLPALFRQLLQVV